MHYLLGLAALVIGAIIATRRTRPTWFVVTTSVLVGIGALLAILSYTRVTDPMGVLPNSVLGWVFVGASIITMLSAVFVLERRGEHGEELPPLIGDNPFDGDTDDTDDPAPGAPAPGASAPGASGREHGDATVEARAEAAASTSVIGAAAAAGVAGAAAAGSPANAAVGVSATQVYAEESAMGEIHTDSTDQGPGPSEGAEDGTTVIGADPDLATPPDQTDVEAAPSRGVAQHGDADGDEGASRP
ncbi:hypothetical protein [Agrococcus sp. Ld7]|uniref:hypothetical protein n=1 Tax=Agrococcus sp. Ld7 TaxID=649148 RepID=UPI00386BA31E